MLALLALAAAAALYAYPDAARDADSRAEAVTVQPADAVTAQRGAPVAPALTRADVREALHLARLGGRVSGDGEAGDTPAVLQAREDFAALQAEVLGGAARPGPAQAEAPQAPTGRRDSRGSSARTTTAAMPTST